MPDPHPSDAGGAVKRPQTVQATTNKHFKRVEGQGDPNNAAVLLIELTNEMSGIARQHRFDTLVYILDMARLEAENIRRGLSQISSAQG